MQKFPKIIQIIPATGWILCFRSDDGEIEETQAVAIALYDDGDIQFLDTDGLGFIDSSRNISNLCRVYYKTPSAAG